MALDIVSSLFSRKGCLGVFFSGVIGPFRSYIPCTSIYTYVLRVIFYGPS